MIKDQGFINNNKNTGWCRKKWLYFEHFQELMGEKPSTNQIPYEVGVSSAMRSSQVQSQHKDTLTTPRSAHHNNNENETPAACTEPDLASSGNLSKLQNDFKLAFPGFQVQEWVRSFLMAHLHIKGYIMLRGKQHVLQHWQYVTYHERQRMTANSLLDRLKSTNW